MHAGGSTLVYPYFYVVRHNIVCPEEEALSALLAYTHVPANSISMQLL
jgi:hypothetical protein